MTTSRWERLPTANRIYSDGADHGWKPLPQSTTNLETMIRAFDMVGDADAINYGSFWPYGLCYDYMSKVRVPGVDLPEDEMWRHFVWPYFSRLVCEVVDAGLIALLHLDSNWTRELGPEGFILQSGCDIPANAKLENVQAMVAAATGG